MPKSKVYELWNSFNDIAEGFGLSIEEFSDIIREVLISYLNLTSDAINHDIFDLFKVFDDDEVCFILILQCLL